MSCVLLTDKWPCSGMYDQTPFICFHIAKSDIGPHIKYGHSAQGLQNVDGHFNLPHQFVCVCVGKYTHFIIPDQKTDLTIFKFAMYPLFGVVELNTLKK